MGLCALCVALVFAGFGGTTPAVADTGGEGSGADGRDSADTGKPLGTDTTSTDNGSTATPSKVGAVDKVPALIGSFGTGTVLGSVTDETSADATSTTHSARESQESQSTALAGPMEINSQTTTTTSTTTASTTTTNTTTTSTTTTSTTDNKGSDTVSASSTSVETTSEPQVVVSSSTVTAPSHPQEPPPSATAAPPAEGPPQPPPPPPQPQPPPVDQPMTNAVSPAAGPVPPSPPSQAPAPVIGAAAAGDIVKALAYLLIALPGDHASLLALPDKLLSLLRFPLIGGVDTAPSTAGGVGGSLLAAGSLADARASAASPRTVRTRWPGLSGAADTPRLSPTSTHPAAAGVSVRGVKEERLSMALADTAVPGQVRSVFRHAIGAVLAPLSLLVLALMASPGLAGLLLLAAAGTFVGYRQARAASVLRSVGIARFVKTGPLGVVRSDTLISVHRRPSQVHRGQSGPQTEGIA